MDDLPPPPYTPHDPSVGGAEAPVSQDAASQPFRPSLRGGYMRLSLLSERPQVSSAAAFVEDRHPVWQNAPLPPNVIEHNITIGPETTRDDIHFPLPLETYIARDDWSTFINYLFSVKDEPVNGNRKGEEDCTSRPFGERDTLESREQIRTVVADWNENFFSPLQVHINIDFLPRRSSSSSRSTIRATSTIGVSPSRASLRNDFVPPKTDFSPRPLQHSDRSHRPHRSHSFSSTSSSSSSSSLSSSSSSSVDSIKSKDLEGADINQVRSALLAFRLDPANKHHLRTSVRRLRDEFRSQSRDLSFRDRKDMKKEFKEQRKEVKKEVKAVIKEVKATRKADRQLRKAEKKARRESKRAESRVHHHVHRAHKRSLRTQERAEKKVLRAQEKAIEAQERAAEKGAKACERAAEGYGRAREAQAREAAAMAGVQGRAADERAGGWWGDAAVRAQATAWNHSSRNWGGDALSRGQQTAWNASNQDCERYGRERGRDAGLTARNASGQDWGRCGRARAMEAEQRAEEIARGFSGGQESGVLG